MEAVVIRPNGYTRHASSQKNRNSRQMDQLIIFATSDSEGCWYVKCSPQSLPQSILQLLYDTFLH